MTTLRGSHLIPVAVLLLGSIGGSATVASSFQNDTSELPTHSQGDLISEEQLKPQYSSSLNSNQADQPKQHSNTQSNCAESLASTAAPVDSTQPQPNQEAQILAESREAILVASSSQPKAHESNHSLNQEGFIAQNQLGNVRNQSRQIQEDSDQNSPYSKAGLKEQAKERERKNQSSQSTTGAEPQNNGRDS